MTENPYLWLSASVLFGLAIVAMVLSDYSKQRILSLYWQGNKVAAITERVVLEDVIKIAKQRLHQFLKHYDKYKTIARKPGSGQPAKLSPAVQQIIEDAMREDDKITTTQLQAKLALHEIYVSLATILRSRKQLHWVYRGSAYCQLIRQENKEAELGTYFSAQQL